MKKIWVHKAKSFEDAEAFDVRFWRRAGAAARFEASWAMVGEWLKLRGKSGDQPLRSSISWSVLTPSSFMRSHGSRKIWTSGFR